ncbi:MAG TPA: glycerate kinase [bacterium]|nr:glycerate kinase [bacterium]
MKIVIASNPFKGSLSGIEVADRIESGLKKGMGGASIKKVPIADGGDGTLDAVASSTKCKRISVKAKDPLGRAVSSEYLLMADGKTAVVEMARVSGLALLKANERNPEKTSTYGTGQLIADALEKGAERFIIGIGGSATNDGGTGIAEALGYEFHDRHERRVKPVGGDLIDIARIEQLRVNESVKRAEFVVACDVTNPLLGKNGAAAVYSPQKGATPKQVAELEKGLKKLSKMVKRDLRKNLAEYPGAGAAGGTGYGLMVFLNAKLKSGIDMMIDITGLEAKIAESDLVVTGEGFMDEQSAQGKAPFGILRLAKKHKKPVIAFCGGLSGEEQLYKAGFKAVIPICDMPMTLEKAMKDGGRLLEAAAARSARLIKTGMK